MWNSIGSKTRKIKSLHIFKKKMKSTGSILLTKQQLQIIPLTKMHINFIASMITFMKIRITIMAGGKISN